MVGNFKYQTISLIGKFLMKEQTKRISIHHKFNQGIITRKCIPANLPKNIPLHRLLLKKRFKTLNSLMMIILGLSRETTRETLNQERSPNSSDGNCPITTLQQSYI
jgi:hypothetical protein